MINLEYHKGQPCVYRQIFCQEGYCSECEIYISHSSPAELTDQEQIKLYSRKARLEDLQTAGIQ